MSFGVPPYHGCHCKTISHDVLPFHTHTHNVSSDSPLAFYAGPTLLWYHVSMLFITKLAEDTWAKLAGFSHPMAFEIWATTDNACPHLLFLDRVEARAVIDVIACCLFAYDLGWWCLKGISRCMLVIGPLEWWLIHALLSEEVRYFPGGDSRAVTSQNLLIERMWICWWDRGGMWPLQHQEFCNITVCHLIQGYGSLFVNILFH